MFRNGDCPSCAEIACCKVSSKTASPVVLLKSASTTVSCSVRIGGRCERQYNPPATMAATSNNADVTTFQRKLRGCCASGEDPAPVTFDGATRGLELEPLLAT